MSYASVLLGPGGSRCLWWHAQADDEESSRCSSSRCLLTIRCQSTSLGQLQWSTTACQAPTSSPSCQGWRVAFRLGWEAGFQARHARDGNVHGYVTTFVYSQLVVNHGPCGRTVLPGSMRWWRAASVEGQTLSPPLVKVNCIIFNFKAPSQ